MKKLLFSSIFLISSQAFAGAYEMYISQLNGTSDNYIGLAIQEGSGNGLMFYNYSTHTPSWVGIGTGLGISGGNLNVTTDLSNYVTNSSLSSTLSGYPTSSSLTSTLSGYATTSALTSGLAGKFNTPTGTTSQYVRGDGSLATFPSSGTGTVTSITAGTGLSGGTITTTGTISLPNTGTSGTYSGVTTDSQGRVTSGTNRSFSYTTRSLNTCFQVSSTRDAFVTYSVDIATSLSLTTGQQGTVYLETFSDSGCTTGTQELTRFVNGQTGTLTVGLALTQNVTGTLTGIVPAAAMLSCAPKIIREHQLSQPDPGRKFCCSSLAQRN